MDIVYHIAGLIGIALFVLLLTIMQNDFKEIRNVKDVSIAIVMLIPLLGVGLLLVYVVIEYPYYLIGGVFGLILLIFLSVFVCDTLVDRKHKKKKQQEEANKGKVVPPPIKEIYFQKTEKTKGKWGNLYFRRGDGIRVEIAKEEWQKILDKYNDNDSDYVSVTISYGFEFDEFNE